MHCSDASLGFEDRFAIFCDQLGDFLEGLVQRAVDVLELFFQLDVADQQVRQGQGRLLHKSQHQHQHQPTAWVAAAASAPGLQHAWAYRMPLQSAGVVMRVAVLLCIRMAVRCVSNNTASACCLGLQLALHAALTNVTLFHTLILVAGRPVPHPTPPPVFCGGRGGRWPAQNDGLRHLPV